MSQTLTTGTATRDLPLGNLRMMRRRITHALARAIVPVVLFFGCSAVPQPHQQDPPYCFSYDPSAAVLLGEAEALNKPSSTEPCPQDCSQCVAAYTDGYFLGMKEAEIHACAVRRCNAQYPGDFAHPNDLWIQAAHRSVFQSCMRIEEVALERGDLEACDPAQIERLEEMRARLTK